MKATLKLEDGREISVEITEDDVSKMKPTGFSANKVAYVHTTGGSIVQHFVHDPEAYAEGFAFHSKEEAEAERMRILSRQKRLDWHPDVGDEYYYYNYFKNGVSVSNELWSDLVIDNAFWNMGNCHKTKEEAEEWGRTYAKYFFD